MVRVDEMLDMADVVVEMERLDIASKVPGIDPSCIVETIGYQQPLSHSLSYNC